MKKLAFGLLALGMFAFSSCKKCQTCTTKVTQDTGSYPVTTSASVEYCGKDYDDAPAETSVTQDAGGVTQTVDITCSDN